MSVAAGAGAAAWVVPEILMAKPAAGATMSANVNGNTSVGTSASTTGGTGDGGNPNTLASTTSPGSSLAFTGVDIKRDAEVGAALVAGGWAMHHWASRKPKLATETATEVHEAGSQADLT